MKVQNWNRKLNRFLSASLVLMAPALSLAPAFADGVGSTGGGLAASDGELLDYWEGKTQNLESFNPAQTPAFQRVLIPALKKLNQKIPGSAEAILNGLPPQMDWYLTDLPIAASSDECKLVKEDTHQIAKQIEGQVAISRTWVNTHSDLSVAGLMLHELVMYKMGKDADQCATRVRRVVRAIMNVDQYSEQDLQRLLSGVGISLNTKTERDHFLKVQNDILNGFCKLKKRNKADWDKLEEQRKNMLSPFPQTQAAWGLFPYAPSYIFPGDQNDQSSADFACSTIKGLTLMTPSSDDFPALPATSPSSERTVTERNTKETVPAKESFSDDKSSSGSSEKAAQ